MSVDEVMAEILKERSYFVRSKGGVTFSGGEAALQADFVRECSRRCRLEYINTAIETAGAVRWETLWPVSYTHLNVGCGEPLIEGKQSNRPDGASFINITKALEMALNDGKDPRTGRCLHKGRCV